MKRPPKKNKILIDEKIKHASMASLEPNESKLVYAISTLRDILNEPLTSKQRFNAQINLATALQHRGEHSAALEILQSTLNLSSKNPESTCWIKSQIASSYQALGNLEEACNLFDEIIYELDSLHIDYKYKGSVLLEAGKAFRVKGDIHRARECWEEALKCFEGKNDELEHFARTKANLALELLHDSDENKQQEGIKILEESSSIKSSIGDLDGLATNYCNLGLYFWKKKRFERAIAYLRRDLFLSRITGNLKSIAISLGNLSQLYVALKQLSPARELLKEARQIGEKLNDQSIIEITDRQIQLVNKVGRALGLKGEKIGPIANCLCESGKTYQECCGRADFDPIDLPGIFGGVSEELEQIIDQVKTSGVEPSRLDFILRDTAQSKQRMSWSKIHTHDGWLEMQELPDMANLHLISAKALAKDAKSDPDSPQKPLACVILSACALEAFINQVAYFLNETANFPESRFHAIPPELSSNVLDFQRNTRLVDKWDILGKTLCGANWPPPKDLWNSFQDLIYVRNELVHFKAAEYEQVVPPPKKPPEIMKHIPASVEIRKIPHSWPIRALTASFADSCVDVTEKMIAYFKQKYAQNRISMTGETQSIGAANVDPLHSGE